MLRGKDMCGSFFRAGREKIAGTGFTDSLWAMNDLAPSLSGMDSHLRQTMKACGRKCVAPGAAQAGCEPSSSILPLGFSAAPPGSSLLASSAHI